MSRSPGLAVPEEVVGEIAALLGLTVGQFRVLEITGVIGDMQLTPDQFERKASALLGVAYKIPEVEA